ncbi:conserved hypothetical protein [Sporisorium reilianum SRZ2]|uniref:LrgB-like protein n=1 Tax=Sporisorium reilianum (strain SRZ2) TaxID=999809 RepID=E6ZQA8_SPORE|nr:conserved hypothetical protein [Sporisorium reilianum SRZ2]
MRSPLSNQPQAGSTSTPPTLLVEPASSTSTPPISATTTASSRSTSGTMTNTPGPNAQHEGRRTSASSSSTASAEACEACVLDRPYVERIRSPAHVLLAARLLVTDAQRRRALFTNWIHVPLGITSLLLLTWLIKQAMDRAPFRFPSPVLAMLLLFVMLLVLDWLSTTAPVRRFAARNKRDGKVLLMPLLTLLEAPCDFCLRYMSVMFTPSFILIPAREMIAGREIGLITGWFAASQLLALVFPVVLHKTIRCCVAHVKQRLAHRKDRRDEQVRRANEQRRASVATLVAVMSSINAVPTTHAAVNIDMDTTSPTEKKHVVGGETLGSIATGLSGMTAIATAPLALNTPRVAVRDARKQDAQRQLDVQLETARQQGDPYALEHTRAQHHHHYPQSPTSARPASALHHNHRVHARGRSAERPQLARSRSLARSWVGTAATRVRESASLSPSRVPRPRSGGAKTRVGGVVVGPGSGLRYEAQRRPQSANDASKRFEDVREDEVSPTFDEYIFRARQDLLERRSSSAAEAARDVDPRGEELETLVMPTLVPTTPTRTSHDDDALNKPRVVTKLHDIEAQPASPEVGGSEKPSATTTDVDAAAPEAEEEAKDEPELDAIDRLVETLWSLIPLVVFLVLLVVGLPVFFALDISLPLFLAVNLLTFLASITLVPPPIRRYLHPILTTSIATVLILWAFGAMRGWTLKQTLASYSVDAKYTVLWALQGYQGPVIGAGDVLFSTLDAGIVSLAIPMYRYRWDLWVHLVDMLVVLGPCSVLSLFVWPTVASSIGIAPERALAFASRFMSTPLAIELSLTIGADESLTVVLVVITGILISIFKDPFFRLFRLNPDQDGPSEDSDDKESQDYLTIGIAMGSTAGAIGASSLISKPRSMAIASLSFVLFGAILLVFAAIPPVVDTLRTLAGAPLQFTPAS